MDSNSIFFMIISCCTFALAAQDGASTSGIRRDVEQGTVSALHEISSASYGSTIPAGSPLRQTVSVDATPEQLRKNAKLYTRAACGIFGVTAALALVVVPSVELDTDSPSRSVSYPVVLGGCGSLALFYAGAALKNIWKLYRSTNKNFSAEPH